jgi:uncharacterized protein YwgA
MIKDLVARIGLDNSRFIKGVKDSVKETDKLKKSVNQFGVEADKGTDKASKGIDKVNKSSKGLSGQMPQLGKMIAGAFSVQAVLSFGKAVINTQAEFQRMEAVLTNTLGSRSAANAAMSQIVDFASKTPFQVNELTDAFVKLSNQGFVPSMEQMTKMGDLASSVGKSFDQLAEAVIDAQVGEFERLKEFGIKASVEGDRVKFSFKGVSTEVGKTSEEIQKYILSLGDLEGVTGGMALISETTGGKLSNLGDNMTRLTKAIGDSSSGLIYGLLTGANAITSHFADALDGLNKVADKFNVGKLERLGMTFAALFDANYANKIKLQAKAIGQLEQASFNAMMAGRAFFEAEGKARSDAYDAEQLAINQSIESNKKRYEELKKAQRDALNEHLSIMKKFKLPVGTLAKSSFMQSSSGLSSDPLATMRERTKGLGVQITPEMTENLNAYTERQKELNNQIALGATLGETLGQTFQTAFQAMLTSGEFTFKGLIQGLKAMIIKILAAVAAAFALNVLLAGVGFAKTSSGSSFGGMAGFKDLFSSLSGLPKFAKGGMVTGLTTAVLGDNPSGKEAVIPFERMGQFLNQFGSGSGVQRVEVYGKIQGHDIVLASSNYNQSINKRYGF